jgi:hypothetical protein
MSETVDKEKAEQNLKLAWDESNKISNSLKKHPLFENIKTVILGSHLTFRYILITGLLAKTTNNKVNAITLQTSSNLKGSYDARSLCHQVVVPFERKYMENLIGGSNEPFLNKPARYKELSVVTNAVRKGNDEKLHSLIIDIFTYLNENKKEAMNMLVIACYFIRKRQETQIKNLNFVACSNNFDLIKKLNLFVTESYEGETTVLTVGAILSCFLDNFGDGWSIKVHPTNQCGASSKEICDIDIYKNDKFKIGLEVKDKLYALQDVEHAVRKVKDSGYNSMFFITGFHGYSNDPEVLNLPQKLLQENFLLFYYSVFDLIRLSISLGIKQEDFLKNLVKYAKEARVKDATTQYIKQIFSN